MMGYEYDPHEPRWHKGARKPVCRKCGLVYLDNALARWFIRHGCEADSHPEHRAAIRRLGCKKSS